MGIDALPLHMEDITAYRALVLKKLGDVVWARMDTLHFKGGVYTIAGFSSNVYHKTRGDTVRKHFAYLESAKDGVLGMQAFNITSFKYVASGGKKKKSLPNYVHIPCTTTDLALEEAVGARLVAHLLAASIKKPKKVSTFARSPL